MKEQYAITELQKQQNRMGFNVAEEEVLVLDETEGLGMINQSLGTGRVRATTADNRTKCKTHHHRYHVVIICINIFTFFTYNHIIWKHVISINSLVKGKVATLKAAKSSSSGATSGLSSSWVFTPVQGLELIDPEAQRQAQEAKVKAANEKWFASGAGYVNVAKKNNP